MIQYSSILTAILIVSLCCLPFVHTSFGVDVRLIVAAVAIISALLLLVRIGQRLIEQKARIKIAAELHNEYSDSTTIRVPPSDVMNSMNIYNSMALQNYWSYRVLGVISLASSLFLAVSLGEKDELIPVWVTKILAFISPLSTGIIFSFNLVEKGNRARKAFRHLLDAVMQYKHRHMEMPELLKRYKEAEEIMGDDEFRNTSSGGASSSGSR